MFYISEIVVFGVHNHTRHVRFAVARVVGNLPVGSLHIKISYSLKINIFQKIYAIMNMLLRKI